MSIGEKILIFIKRCNISQLDFAEIADINYFALSRYISGKNTPSTDSLIKFYNAGMSIDWLLTGVGSMYSNSPKGRKLKIFHEENDVVDTIQPFDRIKTWIRENYGTLLKFTTTMNLKYDYLYSILYEQTIFDPELAGIMVKAGCNLDWIQDGKGTPYADNIEGLLFKIKNNEITGSENIDDKTIEEMKEMASTIDQRLYNIIKLAAKNELSENQDEN